MNSSRPNPPRGNDTWSGNVLFWLLVATLLAILIEVFRPADGARPMWPCDFSCWPAKCQPWCGTPPGVPVREGTPAPFVTPLGDL